MKPIIKPIMKPKLTEYISSVCSASDAAALEQKLKQFMTHVTPRIG